VGLLIHHAQFSLAIDNVEGAKRLIAIHQQLRTLLPETAQRSELGQALLPRGLESLQQAAQAWRKEKRLQLADEAEAWLTKFGVAPAWQWPLPTDRAELGRQFSLTGAGRGAAASNPLRVLDLLGLPAPHDHLDACWAFFDGADRAQSVLLIYQSTQVDYQTPSQWLPRLDVLEKGQPAIRAALTPGNRYAGGVIELRFSDAKPPALARDYGLVSLDRTFEYNRRLAAWKQTGANFTVKDVKILTALKSPLSAMATETTVERHLEHDVPARLSFAFATDPKQTLATVAAPLWERFGAAQVQASKDVSLSWNDGQTRLMLTLPNDSAQPLVVETADGSSVPVSKRLENAEARDRVDRQTRLATNQPLSRLPRGLEALTLGMGRTEVDRSLPGGASALRREIGGGLMATYAGQPKTAADAVVRMIFARFDDAGKLAELRVRYADHPGNKPGTLRKRLDVLQATHGPGETKPADVKWAADLPVRKGSVEPTHVWNDDITRMTCVLDAGSLEVALLQCPPAHPQGEPLPALTFLPRGPEGFSLGMPQSELVGKGGTSFEGALLFKTNAASSYDSILVWCENDKVTRIVARHRATAAEPAKRLPEAWGQDLSKFGWPWRQDLADRTPKAWTTRDAHTRYRLFSQEDNLGAHLLAEWRELK
jgi:hypothetical protein